MEPLVTREADVRCAHGAGFRVVMGAPSQDLVTVEDALVLVETDPRAYAFDGCPPSPAGPGCTAVMTVTAGYSTWVRIAGRGVGLRTLVGLSNSSPPVPWRVVDAGQDLVRIQP